MTLKSWKDVARDIQARTAAQPSGTAAAAAPAAAALLDAAATNPELRRLLQERERLERKMNEIAAGSHGNFAARHDNVRFPVEPLDERRARDARWAESRDESRSAAVRRILEARRQNAPVDGPHPDWTDQRDRQLYDALKQAQSARSERAEQIRALDARIERAREELRNEAASEEQPERRARRLIVGRVEQEHALDRRASRARESQPANRAASATQQSEDWTASRERQLARALDKVRAQAVQDAGQEHSLDRRRGTARETSRAVEPPESEHGADRPTGSDRRLSSAQDRSRAGTPEVSNPQHALDQRLARAREQALAENRAARRRDREQELSALRERPRGRLDALDRRQQRVRDKLERANRTARRVERVTDSALGRAERVVDGLHQLDQSLQRFDEVLDDAGAEHIGGLGKLRSGLDRVLPLADKVEAPLRRARDRQETWQAKRDSAREKLRQFKTFQDSNRRKLSVDAASIDQLTALRDRARELWSDDKDRKKDAQKTQKTPMERAQDLDQRRKQALERLTARREEDRRHEQRQQRGLTRRKSGGDDFRS